MSANPLYHAVTLHQPWAWAVIKLGKNIENRSWAPRESLYANMPMVIHAGQKYDDSAEAWMRARGLLLPNAILPAAARIHGALIGSVIYRRALDEDGVRSLANETGARARDWWMGPVGWMLDDPRAFPAPVPCPGAQRLWSIPPLQLAKIITLLDMQRRQWLITLARSRMG